MTGRRGDEIEERIGGAKDVKIGEETMREKE